MNKEIKYFKSIAKLAIKYSKKQSYDISELKNDLKTLKDGYKHLEGIVESVEGLIDLRMGDIIHDMILRQNTLESNYQALVQQQDKSDQQQAKSPAHEIPEGLKEYTASELQKICKYRSGQTLYNRISTSNLKLKKRKEGIKVFYQVSAEDLEILKHGKSKLTEATGATAHSENYQSQKEILKELGISDMSFYRKLKVCKLKPQIKKEGRKILYLFTKEDKEKLSHDLRQHIPSTQVEKKKII
jgi:hypothetical protein